MTGAAPVTTTLLLDVAQPFALAPLRGFLAAHAVPGLEQHDAAAGTHTRLLRTQAGAARVTGHLGALVDGRVRVDVDVRRAPGAAPPDLVPRLRRWLGLDRPDGVDDALASDPALAPLVAHRPGLRVPGSADPYETALLAVLGQQVSLGAARTFAARLVAGLGATTSPGDAAGALRLSPAPETLLAAGAEGVRTATGVTGARAASLVALAGAVVAGLDLDRARETDDEAVEEATRRLLDVPGVGPWTAGYVRMRALGDPDAFLAGDLVLRRAMGVDRPAEAAARARAWQPFRAYAALHLWTGAVPVLAGSATGSATGTGTGGARPQPSTASTRPTARRASGSGR